MKRDSTEEQMKRADKMLEMISKALFECLGSKDDTVKVKAVELLMRVHGGILDTS